MMQGILVPDNTDDLSMEHTSNSADVQMDREEVAQENQELLPIIGIGPKPILRLSTQVVNKIAAGEIIQRPANALKELLENSLDAGSTRITIQCASGGLKLLSIQDNGHGIARTDLPILCERFTTSKIRKFEDLDTLETYGFRGEALASLSHVGHVTVVTKTKEDTCAWKAAYLDGKLVPLKKGSQLAEPLPCAGNDGTLLTVEDLFFNTPTRLKSLRSASEEYSRIVAVVLSYSIHNAGIAFTCKKSYNASHAQSAGGSGGGGGGGGSAMGHADIQTNLGASVIDNIGLHYGESIKRELLHVKIPYDELLGVKGEGYLSGANYGSKKSVFLFFINHRLVDCTPLKRALEAFYGTLLAKGSHPFVYLSLEIDPGRIDVNVHPTKREVGFEDEEEVVQVVCECLRETLESGSESRRFKVQTLLPGARPVDTTSREVTQSKAGTGVGSKKIAPNRLVRTDQHAQTLDALFGQQKNTLRIVENERSRPRKRRRNNEGSQSDVVDGEERDEGEEESEKIRTPLTSHQRKKSSNRIPESECMLSSVRQLRKEEIANRHSGLEAIVKNHIFVGVADLESQLSMIQYQTKLFLVNHASFAEVLFYQLGLRQFGRFSRIQFESPLLIRDLVEIAMESHGEGSQSLNISPEEIVNRICTLLIDSRSMLDEYFSFGLTEDGKIESLPLILPGYMPNMSRLPLFLIRIGVEVDWEDEKRCFQTFLQELAYFHVPGPLHGRPGPGASNNTVSEDVQGEEREKSPPGKELANLPSVNLERNDDDDEEEKRLIQHVILPAIKTYLEPPASLLDSDVVQVTTLENLYKVFERC